jgi:hypothetical protein
MNQQIYFLACSRKSEQMARPVSVSRLFFVAFMAQQIHAASTLGFIDPSPFRIARELDFLAARKSSLNPSPFRIAFDPSPSLSLIIAEQTAPSIRSDGSVASLAWLDSLTALMAARNSASPTACPAATRDSKNFTLAPAMEYNNAGPKIQPAYSPGSSHSPEAT